MYKEQEVILLKTLTPLHVGGSFQFSVVDQPIQREGHTGFPKIESSSLKGSLRHHLVKSSSGDSEEELQTLFGASDAETASAIAISDAQILFFPVRSAKGIFAFVTSPYVIKRFQRELGLFSFNNLTDSVDFEALPAVCVKESSILIETNDKQKNLLLEEYRYQDVTVNESFCTFVQNVASMYSLDADTIIRHAVLISDDDFSHYVQHSTEITTRIRINERTGTVDDGALFHEEYVSAETIFYSMIFATNRKERDALHWMDRIKSLLPPVFQVGGNATLGKGVLQLLKGDGKR